MEVATSYASYIISAIVILIQTISFYVVLRTSYLYKVYTKTDGMDAAGVEARAYELHRKYWSRYRGLRRFTTFTPEMVINKALFMPAIKALPDWVRCYHGYTAPKVSRDLSLFHITRMDWKISVGVRYNMLFRRGFAASMNYFNSKILSL